MHGPTKINDAFHFLEPKRSVSGMCLHILKWRIRGKLATTFRLRPVFDASDKRTRDTLATRSGLHVEPFKEHDRRAACSVDVVDSLRRFNEAYRRTVRGERKTHVVSTGQHVGHFTQML